MDGIFNLLKKLLILKLADALTGFPPVYPDQRIAAKCASKARKAAICAADSPSL